MAAERLAGAEIGRVGGAGQLSRQSTLALWLSPPARWMVNTICCVPASPSTMLTSPMVTWPVALPPMKSWPVLTLPKVLARASTQVKSS